MGVANPLAASGGRESAAPATRHKEMKWRRRIIYNNDGGDLRNRWRLAGCLQQLPAAGPTRSGHRAEGRQPIHRVSEEALRICDRRAGHFRARNGGQVQMLTCSARPADGSGATK